MTEGMYLVRYVYEYTNVTTLVFATSEEEARNSADYQVTTDIGIYPEEALEVEVKLEGTFGA